MNISEKDLIPNSNSLNIKEETIRFSGAPWFEEVKKQSVILGGAGGISSYVAFLLSRLQLCEMSIYDFDRVDTTNMAGQFYSIDDIGKYKTIALLDKMKSFSNYYKVNTLSEYKKDSDVSNIMICGFDNMKARKTFFNNWLEHVNKQTEEEKKKCLFIDGRLSAETLQIFAIVGTDKHNINKYEALFFDDNEAEQEVCSYKQTSYCACMIGAYITNIFVNFCTNISENKPLIDREIPFFVEYNADTMYLKVNNE